MFPVLFPTNNLFICGESMFWKTSLFRHPNQHPVYGFLWIQSSLVTDFSVLLTNFYPTAFQILTTKSVDQSQKCLPKLIQILVFSSDRFNKH